MSMQRIELTIAENQELLPLTMAGGLVDHFTSARFLKPDGDVKSLIAEFEAGIRRVELLSGVLVAHAKRLVGGAFLFSQAEATQVVVQHGIVLANMQVIRHFWSKQHLDEFPHALEIGVALDQPIQRLLVNDRACQILQLWLQRYAEVSRGEGLEEPARGAVPRPGSW